MRGRVDRSGGNPENGGARTCLLLCDFCEVPTLEEVRLAMRFCGLLVAVIFLLGVMAVQGQEPDGGAFPTPATKKGLQVQMIDDALSLGVGHAALNLNLTAMADLAGHPESVRFKSGEREFTFAKHVVDDLDRRVKPLSDKGVVVYLILLTYASNDPARDALMLHPGFAKGKKDTGPIGMFNIASDEGRAWLTAMMEFLSARYSGKTVEHGRVWGYIAGNEVNSHWYWANMGYATLDEVVAAYEQSVRIIHTAVRKSSVNARVYLSLEHYWAKRYPAGNSKQSVPGRDFLKAFATLARKHGDFDWQLAYHPYPEPLTDCRFWKDKKHSPQSPKAEVVSFRNLDVLSDFMKQEEMLWNGKPRRVIFSEQGFHCDDSPTGERDQAAAYALAYLLVEKQELVDAFILHRHVDHSQEGGLRLGLWTNKPGSIATPDRKRMMYEAFLAAGTPQQEQAFAFALEALGVKSWEEAMELLK